MSIGRLWIYYTNFQKKKKTKLSDIKKRSGVTATV